MNDSESSYISAVRDLYLQLPVTANRFTRSDRLMARNLLERRIPIPLLRDAFLLGAARRLARNPKAPPLEPVRSLHYFIPIIEEIQRNPLPPLYVQYLELKVRQALRTNRT